MDTCNAVSKVGSSTLICEKELGHGKDTPDGSAERLHQMGEIHWSGGTWPV